MHEKRWVYTDIGLDESIIRKEAQSIGVDPLIIKLLYNRGIKDSKDISDFLKKPLSCVHNPMLLNDMDKAVHEIQNALNKGEKICIYGDYDVDGITSTALLYKYLLSKGADVSYYIPQRMTEGYGLNIQAINKISKSGCKLLITVDCGITAKGEVELAKAQGMKVIITDHHNPSDALPNAAAVINPKLEDSLYPFRELAGVGVAFKLVLALALAFKEDTKAVFTKYCTLAAIGTIADVVSLTDENRIIAKRGIDELIKTGGVGIDALIKASGISKISSTSVSFGIAPRINAAGRMGSAKEALELLLTEDLFEAEEKATFLEKQNQKRKASEQEIFDAAEAFIKNHPDMQKNPVYVIHGEDWHMGVIGIVASRLCEKYYKPIVIISSHERESHGSLRSIEGFDIYKALLAVSDTLIKFGGHTMAAGISLDTDAIEDFTKKINEYAKSHMTEEMTTPVINIDAIIHPAALTVENVQTLWNLEPFGEGNPVPLFSIIDAQVVSAAPVGEKAEHLRLQLSKDGYLMNAIAFRMGTFIKELQRGRKIHIAFSPEINSYNNKNSVSLRIVDIKL